MYSCYSSGRTQTTSKSIKRPSSSIYEDDEEPNEVGIETEAEKQMKILLDKQLKKDTSIKEQFSQHRKFTSSSKFNSLTELVQGKCSLEKFKEIEKSEDVHQELQRCGLTEEEIAEYLGFKAGKETPLKNPFLWEERMRSIEDKISNHNQELMQPQVFTNVKKLTRHEMDLEKTLYAGCSNKTKLQSLVSVQNSNFSPEIDSALNYVEKLSKELLDNYKKKKKKKKSICSAETQPLDVNENPQESPAYDPNIHHVIVPLDERDIAESRLNIDEIKKLPKFENYEIGSLNKTLYIKNLHSKVTVSELRSVFGHFEEENKIPIDYKICSGRMRGQAFIQFSDAKIAEKALHYANGFILRHKPIIIQFGRKVN